MTILERPAPLPEQFARWFASRGWTPRAHQLELLAKARAGHSVLLIAPTGGGKTLAGFLPSLVELSEAAGAARSASGIGKKLISLGHGVRREGGLHTLYISPLKALAVDIARNLEQPLAEMNLPIRIETRTGDTPASKRQRQRRDPPEILLTTPEQVALLLASAGRRRICSARSSASSSTSCTHWSPRSAAICCRSGWRGCFVSRPASPASVFRRRLPSRTTFAVSWCRNAAARRGPI